MNVLKKLSAALKQKLPTAPADHREMWETLSSLTNEALLSEYQTVLDEFRKKLDEGIKIDGWLRWQYSAITQLMEEKGITIEPTIEKPHGMIR